MVTKLSPCIGTAELSADLSQSPAQGSVAASPAHGAVSCRRHDGLSSPRAPASRSTPEIQPWTVGCRFGSSIPQHGLGPSRGSPAAAPVPRFPSAGTSFSYVSGSCPGSSILRHRTQPRAAGCRSGFSIPSSGFGHGSPAAGPAPRSPAPDPAANLHIIGEW